MKKRFLRYFIIVSSILLLLAMVLCAYIWVNRNKVTSYVVEEINTQIRSKVDVSDITLSFFHQFPDISLDFRNVHVSEPESPKKTLLRASHVFISFNIYDILTGTYHIKDLSIDSGICNLWINKKGVENYLVFKDEGDTSSMLFRLKRIGLRDVQVNWNDDLHQQHYRSSIQHAEVSLERNATSIVLNAQLQSTNTNITSGTIHLIKNKNVLLDLLLKINLQEKILEIPSAILQIEALPFKVSGTYRFNNSPFADFKATAPEATLSHLLTVMPFKLPAAFNQYKSTGSIECFASIKGAFTKNKLPAYKIGFKIHQGSLTEPESGVIISAIECTGDFSNEGRLVPILTLQHFNAQTEGGQLQGNLKITYDQSKHIELDCKGNLPLKNLLRFLPNQELECTSGNIEGTFSINGALNDLGSRKALSTISNGNVTIQVIGLTKGKEELLKKANLNAQLVGGDLIIHTCSVDIGASDFELKGSMQQFIPWFFNQGSLQLNLSGQSNELHAEDILWNGPDDSDTTKTGLASDIALNLAFKVNKFQYHLFEATQVEGGLNLSHSRLNLNSFSCNSMGGHLSISGQSEAARNGMRLVNATCQMNKINMHELFRECADFGQQEITYQHINGTLNGKIEMVSVWDKNWNCLTDKLFVTSDLQLLNGEIKGYKPLESLSRFAEVEELRNLRFAELKNKISITGRTIQIPEMELINNALNITLSGTHNFDQIVDYRFKVKLKELLAGKRRKAGNEFGEEEENGSGLYLYLTMKGPMSNPKISYDKLAVKQKISADLSKEKETMKELFKKEFGLGKDSLIKEKETNDGSLEFEKDE